MMAYGAFLAWSARGHPSLFNESQHIAVAIYNTAVFGVIFVVLTKAVLVDQRQVKLFECVGVLFCATITLVALFAPMIRSIFFPTRADLIDAGVMMEHTVHDPPAGAVSPQNRRASDGTGAFAHNHRNKFASTVPSSVGNGTHKQSIATSPETRGTDAIVGGNPSSIGADHASPGIRPVASLAVGTSISPGTGSLRARSSIGAHNGVVVSVAGRKIPSSGSPLNRVNGPDQHVKFVLSPALAASSDMPGALNRTPQYSVNASGADASTVSELQDALVPTYAPAPKAPPASPVRPPMSITIPPSPAAKGGHDNGTLSVGPAAAATLTVPSAGIDGLPSATTSPKTINPEFDQQPLLPTGSATPTPKVEMAAGTEKQ
jgi:hypothetical protein